MAFRFGAPPAGVNVLEQVYRLGLAQELEQFWQTWEQWFTTMSETHLTNMEVLFYRSSRPANSWVTTAGAILDACSLFSSTIDRPDGPWLRLCFQAGCRTLLALAANLGPSLEREFASGEHVTRAAYDAACKQLERAGGPLKLDREESWQTFLHMRSQYAAALFVLTNLIYAPLAPWPSEEEEL